MTKSTDQNDRTMTTPTIDRRTLLGRGAAAVGGLAAAQSLLPSRASAAPRARKPPSSANGFTVAIAGEAMLSRPFASVTDPNLLALVKVLRDADVAYAHLETNIAYDHELKWASHGSTSPAGYLVADPQVVKDLAWAGIDTMSVGNNHSFDWGADGLMATIRHCNDAGIVVAGTGENLEMARAPSFLDAPKGRVALISVASGNSAFEWAGLPQGAIPGRPGVNPLRLRTVYEVPNAAAEQLHAIGASLHIDERSSYGPPQPKTDFNITPGALSGSNGFSGFTFRESDKFRIVTECSPGDVRANLRSVDEATKMADFVMVAHHNSTSEGTRSTTPSDFVVDFAHQVIDGGADVYLGHGWHTFLGIEIYKGKPIFFGLGSLFVQSQFMTRVPADQYESYNFDPDKLTALNPASGNLHPGGGNTDWEWSAIFELKYENNKLVGIDLHPVEISYDFSGEKPTVIRQVGEGEHKYIDGSPRLAVGANGQAILQKLQKINALRGTQMAIQGNVGVITV